MGLHEELDRRLKDAMKAKDERVLDVVRMIRSRAKKEAIEKGGELDDELYLATITTYVKQMRRAVTEYEAAGESGLCMAEKLRYEVAYLEPFLPAQLDEDAVRGLVRGMIEQHGISDRRQAGRVVGLVMKEHKGEVEPALVKQIAEEELS